MKCEYYREALIERAAVGGKIESKLANHLGECAQCRAKLQHEERLFVAIDEALRTKVNETPRTSFLAEVRAQIREQAPPKSQRSAVWALVGTALAVAVIAMSHLGTAPPGQPVEARREGEILKGPTVVAPRPLELADSRSNTKSPDARVQTPHNAAKRPVEVQTASSELEVLVPPDEGKSFHQFVVRLRRHEQVVQTVVGPVVSSVLDERNELSEIAPVEIALLQLKPLVSENLNDQNKETLCEVIACHSYSEER